MTITKTTRHEYSNGKIKGLIFVTDGKKKHTVQYDRDEHGNIEQWGAPTEVLCKTYSTTEKLCQTTE